MVAFPKGQWWNQQEIVISEPGWHSAILPCMACCLGSWFLAGWTTKMASCESPIDLSQQSKCTVSGKRVSLILAMKAAQRTFFTAKMHYFLPMHSSPRLDFGMTKIKHSWIPEQQAKVDSKRILHFHCNIAILDLGLNTLGTVPYVLVRFCLICSSSRLGRIPTVGACLLPEWSLLHFGKCANCSFNSVLILKTMPVLPNLWAFSSAEPWPCSASADWNTLAACSLCKLPTKRICCFCGTGPSSCKWKWFRFKMSSQSQECAPALCLEKQMISVASSLFWKNKM